MDRRGKAFDPVSLHNDLKDLVRETRAMWMPGLSIRCRRTEVQTGLGGGLICS